MKDNDQKLLWEAYQEGHTNMFKIPFDEVKTLNEAIMQDGHLQTEEAGDQISAGKKPFAVLAEDNGIVYEFYVGMPENYTLSKYVYNREGPPTYYMITEAPEKFNDLLDDFVRSLDTKGTSDLSDDDIDPSVYRR